MYQQSGKQMNDVKRYVTVQVRRRCSGVLRTGVMLAICLFALPDAWALDAAPTTLTFQAVQGSPSPSGLILNLLNNKKNARTLDWSSSDNATWLHVSPTTGSITSSAQISVSVNPAGLAAGTYTGTITVSATKGGGSISVPVTLTVTSGSTSSTSTTTSTSNGTATLTWDPSTSTNVAGYKVYMGTASGTYSSSITVESTTNYTVSDLAVGSTYYFAVTAYNASGIESSFSNEVSKSIY